MPLRTQSDEDHGLPIYRRPSGSSIISEASLSAASGGSSHGIGGSGRRRLSRRGSLREMAAAMEASAESDTQRLHSLHKVELDDDERSCHSSVMRARLAIDDDYDSEEDIEGDDDDSAFGNSTIQTRSMRQGGGTIGMHQQQHQEEEEEGEKSGMVRIETTSNGEHRITKNATGHNVVHISVPEYDPDDDLDDVLHESLAYRDHHNKKSKHLVSGGAEGGKDFPGDFPKHGVTNKSLGEFLRSKTCYKISVVVGIILTALFATLFAIFSKKSFVVDTTHYPPVNNDPNAPPPLGVDLPAKYDQAFSEWFDPNGIQPGVSAVESKGIRDDVPLYWSIPLSANLVMEDVLGSCLNLVLAAEIGIVDGHGDDDFLKIVQVYGSSYVNVDITTPSGINRAINMDLIPSNIADVLHTPLLHDATRLFTEPFVSKGRVFTILRHPIDRATAVFKYLRQSRFEGHEELQSMSLEQYATSFYVENNWLTRFLSNKSPDDELTDYDLNLSKEVLRRKVLLGMYDDVFGALKVFQSHFHWTDIVGMEGEENDLVTQCAKRLTEEGMSKEGRVDPPVEEGSDAWNLLMQQNQYDMDLFMYARALHQYQVDKITRRRRDLKEEVMIDAEEKI